jgi:iron complex outermembrane receptor protein
MPKHRDRRARRAGRCSAGKNLLLGIALVALLAPAVPLCAQQDDGSPPVRVPQAEPSELIVTAPRLDLPLLELPASVSLVDGQTLKSMPRSVSADEALALIPGVKVENQTDDQRVHLSIRGQGILTEHGIRGIQVVLDGLPLNDPSGFAPDLFDVDWATVRKVEVLRGPQAPLYGGGAAGGVVAITTRDGRGDPDRFNVEAAGGSYGFRKLFAEASGWNATRDYRISASRTMSDGWREHTHFFCSNAYGKFRLAVTPAFQLNAIVIGTDAFNENPEGLNVDQVREDPRQPNPDAITYNELQHTKRGTVGLVGRYRIARGRELAFTAYYRRTRYTESVPSDVEHRTMDNPGATFLYKVTSGKGPHKNTLTAGADFGWQTIDGYSHPNLGGAIEGPALTSDQTVHQRSVGAYLMDVVSLGGGWGLFGSVRNDRIRNELADHLKAGGLNLSGARNFEKTTGRAGITWNPCRSAGFYASWGQGFLPPATEELYANPDHVGGFNEHLVPATSTGEEIGVRGTVGKVLDYDADVFLLNTNNDFERYRVTGRPLETFYRNAGTTHRYGLETSLTWRPVDRMRVHAAYTYSHFTYDRLNSLTFGEAAGNRMPDSPTHMGGVDADWSPLPRLTLGLSTYSQSRQYIDPTNLTWIGGYTLVNLRLAYRFHARRWPVEASATIRNALDKRYIAFTEPDPDGNSYQPGPGREFFVSLQVRFGKR